jgi:hypothetical protein
LTVEILKFQEVVKYVHILSIHETNKTTDSNYRILEIGVSVPAGLSDEFCLGILRSSNNTGQKRTAKVGFNGPVNDITGLKNKKIECITNACRAKNTQQLDNSSTKMMNKNEIVCGRVTAERCSVWC